MNAIEDKIEIFKLLNSPVILRVINLLLHREECNVTEIHTTVNTIDQTGISRMLRKLRTLGLARYRKDGTLHFYQLTEKGRTNFEVCLADILRSEDVFQEDLRKL